MHRRFTLAAFLAAVLLAFIGSTRAQAPNPPAPPVNIEQPASTEAPVSTTDPDAASESPAITIPVRKAERMVTQPASSKKPASKSDGNSKNNAPSVRKSNSKTDTSTARKTSGTRASAPVHSSTPVIEEPGAGVAPSGAPAIEAPAKEPESPPVSEPIVALPEPVAAPAPPAELIVAAAVSEPPTPPVHAEIPAPKAEAAPKPAPAPAPDPVGYPPGLNAGTAIDLQWPIPADLPSVNPEGKGKVTSDEVIANLAHSKIAINLAWTLITGFLVMIMQAGFALVETGLTRAKNAAHVMSVSFLIYPLGMLGFWFCGFALMFGGYWNGPVAIGWQSPLGQGLQMLNQELTVTIFGKTMGLIGMKGFCLGSSVFDSAIFALFLFQGVFMVAASNIPPGALAERWNFKNFVTYGLWMGTFCYPIYGNWVWGGGWLAQLGFNFGLGHGHVDFAGSSVVHMTGGVAALVGAWLIGPRLGKYSPTGKPRPIPGHNVTYVILGTFILAFGWFGFNPGSTLAGADLHISVVAVNTMLASAAGAIATMLVFYWRVGTPDPTMVCNGMLAGLVAITAPCAFVNSIAAVLIGLAAGVLVVFAVLFIEGELKIDDPAGAISVHGVCGTFGALCVGLFANGSYGAGWGGVHTLVKDGVVQTIINDGAPVTLTKFTDLLAAGWVDQGVTGLFGPLFGGAYWDGKQLMADLIGVLVNIVFVGLFSFVWFKFSNRIFPLRSSRNDELDGLDIPELGVEAYPDYELNDRSSPPV
ncbi:MAG: ammonium transporter [Chthoniobacteraceae bacterium]|nr:ammonium transporter [Chthoniobacteraceae bacterium]